VGLVFTGKGSNHMIIAVASGKGGTGKTTVATSLAQSLSRQGQSVSVLDCDVEAPNAHLFLGPKFHHSRDVNRLIPQVNMDKCTGCGRCAEVCQFHAIVVLGRKTLIFPELCHGCGSCTLECPEKAIAEFPVKLGNLEAGSTSQGITFARGLLDVGEPMAVPVIHQLKAWQPPQPGVICIWDSPPGTSCPVVESIRGADYLLLVTEPTPFGLHDLMLAVQLATELEIPAGVVINRDGVGDNRVDAFCEEAKIPILMRIPLEREIGAGIAQGKTLIEIRPEYRDRFQQMYAQIRGQMVKNA
jgi:MinD superfamily P-loop ATPase